MSWAGRRTLPALGRAPLLLLGTPSAPIMTPVLILLQDPPPPSTHDGHAGQKSNTCPICFPCLPAFQPGPFSHQLCWSWDGASSPLIAMESIGLRC